MIKWIVLLLIIPFICAAKITVLELDTGIDRSHPQINSHLPKNPANVLDYIPIKNHGTHVAGLILKNVCDEVELESCSWFDVLNPNGDFKEYLACLKMAAELKPDIINISAVGTHYEKEEFDLLKKLSDMGIIIVVAAGNEGRNLLLPGNDFYPAKYALNNLIPVGSLDKNGIISSFSNHGLTNEVYESGVDIRSTWPNGTYGFMTGTSQATAIHTNRILLEKCKKLHETN